MRTLRLFIAAFMTVLLVSITPCAPLTATAQAAGNAPLATTFVPFDGSWTGSTSLGESMSFTVSGSGTWVSTFVLNTRFNLGGCSGTLGTTVPGPVTISGNHFSWSGSTFQLTGDFTSATTATGTYQWTSYYIYGCGYFTQSGTWAASVPPPPPGAFSKSAPSNAAIDRPLSLTLSWGASSNATSYEYCYDTTDDGTCDGSWASAGSALSASISGLDASTTYFWQVRAQNGSSTTDANAGTWWSFTTGVPPGALGKSVPADGSGGQWFSTMISWGASSGATSYQYCYDTTNDNACSGTWQSAGASTSAMLNSLAQSTSYYWQVQAVNAIGVTAADGGTWWSFTTGATPVAFGKVSPPNAAANQPRDTSLAWGSSSDATSYEYCVDKVNNNVCDNSWVGNGSATTVNPPGLYVPGTTYYWQVRALNSFGFTEADGGSWWSFATLPPLQMTLYSTGAHDGWILEKSENGNAGATMNPIEPTFTLGDDAGNKQYRAILSFNTASIPPGAVIMSVTLKIRKASGSPSNPYSTLGSLLVDMKKGPFGLVGLQLTDWQAVPSKLAAMTIANTPVNMWYSRTMNAANLVYINRTGLTQFRLRFTKDDDNDRVADFLKFYSGNTLTPAYRPALVIQYYFP